MRKKLKFKVSFQCILLLLPFIVSAGNPDIIENKGQWKKDIYARATLQQGYMYLEYDKITFNLFNLSPLFDLHFNPVKNTDTNINPLFHGHAYSIDFVNANPAPKAVGENTKPNYYNFFLGNDKSKWQGHVKAYKDFVLKKLYNKINLVTSTKGSDYKFEFHVFPEGNYKDIQLAYNGVDPPSVDDDGNLITETNLGVVLEHKPVAWQIINGEKHFVNCKFKVKNNVVSFKIRGKIDKNALLVIDPVLKFCSYSGSHADNFGMSATYDSDGDLLAGGTAFDIGYPTTLGAYDTTFFGPAAQGITDVVISKYDSSGTFLHYSTYLGGKEAETIHSMIVDDKDQLYVYGLTGSSNFPITQNAYDQSFNGGTYLYFPSNGTLFRHGTDMYVAKFSTDGSNLLASTYMGGSKNDGANYSDNRNYDTLQHNYSDQYRGEIVLDKNGDCYIATCTRSGDFPIVNGFQTSLNGEQDAIVFKLSKDLSNLDWSTYLGGNNKDAAYSLKVDSTLHVFVTGGTASHDFPTTSGAYETNFQGGVADAFVSKIDSTGNLLLNSTFIGTSSYDQSYLTSIDRWGNVYIVGQTDGNFPISPGVYSNPGSGQFIAKLNNDLSNMIYSTVFGNGTKFQISPSAFLVDYCGNVYVSGWGGSVLGGATAMSGMPLTNDAFQKTTDGFDFYLIVFQRNLTQLTYATYFGGNKSPEHVDGGTSRFDKNGIIYQSICAGCWGNSDLPTTPGAWSNTNNSIGCNNGVFKFDFEIMPTGKIEVSDTAGCVPFTIQFANKNNSGTNYLWVFGDSTTSTLRNPVKTYKDTGTFIVDLIIEDTICGFKDTVRKKIIVEPQLHLATSNDTNLCNPTQLTFTAYTRNSADTFIWSFDRNFSDTLNQNTSDSSFTFYCDQDTVIYVQVKNEFCSRVDSIKVISHIIFIYPQDTGFCTTNKATIHAFFRGDTNGLKINWGPASNIVSGGNTSHPVVLTHYGNNYFYITATNSYGCTTKDTLQVYYEDVSTWKFNISANPDTIFSGDTSKLNISPKNNFTFSWQPSSSLIHPNSDSPEAHPRQTTEYIVTIKGPYGCTVQRRVKVYVKEVDCEAPFIFVPNAFTPNADGQNDVLFVRGKKYIKKMYFAVYDRWGEKVFETKNINKGWDGTYKGKNLNPAVYDYYLKVTCIDNQDFFKKGNVTLIR